MKNCKSLFGDYEGYAARIEDARQLTFLIERLESGHVAVFVPGTPSPQSGSVYFMAEDRIKPVNIPPASALKCLRCRGVGSNALLRGQLDYPATNDLKKTTNV
jgi:uncharacterized membrane protein